MELKRIDAVTSVGGRNLVKPIEYLEVQPDSPDTAKPAILLLHGMRFNAGTWKEVGTLEKLKEWGFKAIAVNLYYSDNDEVCPGNDEKGELLQLIVAALNLSSIVIVSPSASGRYSVPFIMSKQNQSKIAGYIPVAPVIDQAFAQSRFTELKMPALVVRGANDLTIGRSSQTKLQNIPDSKLEIMADCGHACYLDNPDRWHTVLKDFLNTLPASV